MPSRRFENFVKRMHMHTKKGFNPYIYIFSKYIYKIKYKNHFQGLTFCTIRVKNVGVKLSSETVNARHVNSSARISFLRQRQKSNLVL